MILDQHHNLQTLVVKKISRACLSLNKSVCKSFVKLLQPSALIHFSNHSWSLDVCIY